jgi:hypothetical protein
MTRSLLALSLCLTMLLTSCGDTVETASPSPMDDSGTDSADSGDDANRDPDVGVDDASGDPGSDPDEPDLDAGREDAHDTDVDGGADVVDDSDAGDNDVSDADADVADVADADADVADAEDADADADDADAEDVGELPGLRGVRSSVRAEVPIVTAAGADLNGDGVADLAIGAPTANGGSGTVWIFYGPVPQGRLVAASADVVLQGPADAQAGRLLRGGGNLHGDSSDELVVAGAETVWLVSDPAGPTLALADLDAVIDVSATGLERSADHDDDGVDDFVVVDGDGVHLFRGGFGAALTVEDALVSVPGRHATAGDLDGDGFAELVVGVAPRRFTEGHPMWDDFEHGSLGAELAELADIYQGPVGAEPSVASTLIGYELDAEFGAGERDWRVSSLSSGGDATGDGETDLLVGVSSYSTGPNGGDGLAMVVAGGPRLPRWIVANREPIFVPEADASVAVGPYRVGESVEGREAFGTWVRFAGDLNGDPTTDWLFSGAVFFHGFSVTAVTGSRQSDVTFGDISDAPFDDPAWLPDAVVPVGDVTGDGADNLAVLVDGALYLVTF